MSNSRDRTIVKRQLLPWLTLCVGLLVLGALIWRHDPAQIFAKFRQLDIAWLWLSLLLLVATTLLGAANVFILLEHSKRPSFTKFLPIYWLSWGIGLVVPGQVGDLATLSLAFRKYGMNATFTLGRTLLDKLLTLLAMSIVATGGLISLADSLGWNYGRYAWPILIVIALGFVLLLRHTESVAAAFGSHQPGLAGGIGRTTKEFLTAIKSAPGAIALNAMLSLIKIGLTGSAYWTMFAALGYDHQPIWPIVSYATLAGLVAYVPISFNGYGTVEAAGLMLFGQLGIPAAIVLAAYLGLRLLVLALAWLPSLLFLLFARKTTSAQP